MPDHVWLITFKLMPDWPNIGTTQLEVWLDPEKAYDRYEQLKKPDQRNEWVSVQRVEIKDAVFRN